MFGAEDLEGFIVPGARGSRSTTTNGSSCSKEPAGRVRELTERVEALIVTRGAGGSDIIRATARAVDPGRPGARRSWIPTGCGDAYRAGLIHGLLHGLDWRATGQIASLLGAIKIESRGTQNHHFTRGGLRRSGSTPSRRERSGWVKLGVFGIIRMQESRQMANDYLFTSESVSEGHPGQGRGPDLGRGARCHPQGRSRAAASPARRWSRPASSSLPARSRPAPGSTSKRWCARPCSTSATTPPRWASTAPAAVCSTSSASSRPTSPRAWIARTSASRAPATRA